MTIYSCLPGFSSNDEYPNTTCNGSHWSSVRFACSDISCGPPPDILNTVKVSDGFYNGSMTVYSCLPGFSSNNEYPNTTCNGSHWSSVQFACSDISCGPPSDISNTIKVSDGFHNGSMTIYSCLPGFSSNDEYPNTTCNGSHWSSVQFACSVPNAYYTVDNNTATYHCNHGYIGNQTNTTIRCVNSQWESITLSCSNFSCGTPPDILNTVKLSDGYHKGSMTIYSCLPGFSSNNEYPNATCNGSHWSSVQFACSEQACSYPPDVANAFKVTNGFSNGSTTSYMCMSGYIANGAIPVISCNGTHWTKTLFSCSRQLETNLTTNDTAIAYALEGLKIPRKKTTTYNRSLNCASDSRPSAQAIGAVGLVVISLFVLLIILADCVSFYQKRRLRNITKKTKMR
ncbi:sushi, von Willebrand factor type A, EGF and pentraxin domain-containing protein 1-like [Saccostrea echinata]|uniref:sushi, von Willebrand factor type A, EGF and pentraxin domain-containing protein 1-like n=1 Tax=Saccostrea echinata TaxID=191078 RepID=UPI002A805470|nr:sushi, von Willebrand factor type A, EGF and pentraxin domain-containing protein 1-like [Saccostrea echinata]